MRSVRDRRFVSFGVAGACVLLLTGCASFRGGAVPQDAARYIERDSSVKSAIVYQSNVAKTFADDWFISADVTLRQRPDDVGELITRAAHAAWATRAKHAPQGVFVHFDGPGSTDLHLDRALQAAGWDDAVGGDDGSTQVLIPDRELEPRWTGWPGDRPDGL